MILTGFARNTEEKLTEAMNDNTRLINNNKELRKKTCCSRTRGFTDLKKSSKVLKKSKEKAESEKSEHEKNSVPKEKKASDAKNNMTEQSDDIPVNVLSNED